MKPEPVLEELLAESAELTERLDDLDEMIVRLAWLALAGVEGLYSEVPQ